MTTVEEPNDAALAFEANAEYVAQILEEALSRLQIEHTEKEKVKTELVSAYQQLAARSLQLKDEINEKERTLEQVAELHREEQKLQVQLHNIQLEMAKHPYKNWPKCGICLVQIVNVILSPCGHLFCAPCINKWFKTPRKDGRGRDVRGTLKDYCPRCNSKKGAIQPHPDWDPNIIQIFGVDLPEGEDDEDASAAGAGPTDAAAAGS